MKYNVETQFGTFECTADLFLTRKGTEVHLHRVNGLPPTLANVGGCMEGWETIVNELHKIAAVSGDASSGNDDNDNDNDHAVVVQSAESCRAGEILETDTIHVGACGFCGGDIVVPQGHSFGACYQCGSI